MLVTSGCWLLYVGDNFRVLVTELRYWWHLLDVDARRWCEKIEDVGDLTGWNRHQHLIVVNKFDPYSRPYMTLKIWVKSECQYPQMTMSLFILNRVFSNGLLEPILKSVERSLVWILAVVVNCKSSLSWWDLACISILHF